MKEIIAPRVVINELRVENLNLSKKLLELSFGYSIRIENLSNNGRIHRNFVFEDKVINFILTVLDDLKKVAGTQTSEIENQEDVKEKLVHTLNRLSTETKNLAKIKEHEKYMKAFNKINCYKIKLETSI